MKIKITNIKSIFTFDKDSNSVENLIDKELLIEDGNISSIDKHIPFEGKIVDANNCVLTPGFIDSHTHPIFIGNRANEFNMRCMGRNYNQIAKNGGGINSSVNQFRKSNLDEIYDSSIENINQLLINGSTTVEAKSGYGLSLKDEIKSLEVIRKINDNSPIDVIPTFMGAHAIPKEFSNNKQKYIDLICNEMIPEISEKKLANFCDVFCEKGYFNLEETKSILLAAIKHKMKIKIHADEFSDIGAIGLAAELNATSVEHLMNSSNQSIRILGKSNVIGTLLPATSFFLGGHKYADGRKMVNSGVDIALATDFNPGSSTITSLPMVMLLSMLYCGLTINESFKAVTYNAAKALSLDHKIGMIRKNYKADLLFWDIEELVEIPYWFNSNKLRKIMKDGKFIS